MATEYPNSEFIGIDKAELFPRDIRPPNVNFIKHDILTGIPMEDNSIDLVQMRLFSVAFTRANYASLLKEAYRVIKPGGFIQLMEAELVVCENGSFMD